MSFINSQQKEINCKIIYYGPASAGKSTSLQAVYEKTAPSRRGKIVSLSDDSDRTLFFDFLPLTVGKVKGYTIRLHLYTVPGQKAYDSSRKIILKGTDGIIFVADSQFDRLEENLESWKNLQASLKLHDVNFQTVPMALQLNKRDLPHILPAEELSEVFAGRTGIPSFETVATKNKNVMDCFQAVAKQVLAGLKG
jgi:hypothetical protein